MKLNEMCQKEVRKEMPLGKNNVTFEGLRYRLKEDDEVTGAWIDIKEYKSLFIPIFEEENYQLDLLLEQLEVTSYDPEEINKASGKRIIAHKYLRTVEDRPDPYTNISFNPRYNEVPAVDETAQYA
jgi:hypothetical protein